MADEHFCATILLAERAELFGPFALARAAGVCTPAKDHVFDVSPIGGGNCGFQRSCGVLRSSAGSEIIFSENRLMRPAGAGYAHYTVVSCEGCFPRSAMGSTWEARPCAPRPWGITSVVASGVYEAGHPQVAAGSGCGAQHDFSRATRATNSLTPSP